MTSHGSPKSFKVEAASWLGLVQGLGHMTKILLLLVGFLFGGVANACQCSFIPLDSKQAQAARNVFVFRLTDARIAKDTTGEPNDLVAGTIKVLAHVRGRTNAQEIRYSTSWCCGSRLEVGKYYIAFLSLDARRFDANASNVLPLWQGFGRDEAERLESVLRGRSRLEEDFAYGVDEIQTMRPPPLPCPDQSKKDR